MKTSDVTNTLELALQASGCDQVAVRHKPRLLSDNGAITSQASWLTGWATKAWIMFAGRHTIPKHRVRSREGIKP